MIGIRPERWITFDGCQNKNRYLGFVLVEDDKIVCIDLDNAIVDGKLTPMAEEIIKEFSGTYMEVIPIRKGYPYLCQRDYSR